MVKIMEKTKIKIESGTIGKSIDYGINDVYHMGAVMAPSASYTISKHLKDTGRTIDYYDLILTGDLGIYGKDILKDLLKKEHNIKSISIHTMRNHTCGRNKVNTLKYILAIFNFCQHISDI